MVRPWDDTFHGKADSLDNALRRVDAAFEFFQKIGVEYYAFHDIDAAPEGANLNETEKILEGVTDHLKTRQKETGVKLLWATQNMFSHPRFMNGAATNPDITAFAWACAKTKMASTATWSFAAACVASASRPPRGGRRSRRTVRWCGGDRLRDHPDRREFGLGGLVEHRHRADVVGRRHRR